MSSLSDRLAAIPGGEDPRDLGGRHAAPSGEPPVPDAHDLPVPPVTSAATGQVPTTDGPDGGATAAAAAPTPPVRPSYTSPTAAAPGATAAPAPRTSTSAASPGTRAASTTNTPSGRVAAASRSLRTSDDRFDDIKESVHNELLIQLGPQLYDAELSLTDLESRVRAALVDVMASDSRPMTATDRQRIIQEIADDILGYGPIEPYLRDPEVTEVMVNGSADVWLELKGKLTKVDAKFRDEAHLRRTIDKIVSRIGRRVDEASPMVDARLADGSRVNAVVPPLAIDGSSLTIRKFAADPLTVDNLIEFGSLSAKTAAFLEACVRGRLNVIVSGGTGAGKTTTLNVLSSFIPGDERIVTIEDAAELQLKQDHVVRLESRPSNIEGKGAVTIRDLVKNSLRMRPDRIIVGEVRDASALDMLQAMNTGHDGSICTVHSNGPRDTLSRIETMVLMAGMDLPMRAIREQVASAVDLIVHQTRLKDGSRRITHITEVERMEGDVITLQDVFLFDTKAGFDDEGRSRGTLRATGLRPKFLEKLADANVHVDPRLFMMEAVS